MRFINGVSFILLCIKCVYCLLKACLEALKVSLYINYLSCICFFFGAIIIVFGLGWSGLFSYDYLATLCRLPGLPGWPFWGKLLEI